MLDANLLKYLTLEPAVQVKVEEIMGTLSVPEIGLSKI